MIKNYKYPRNMKGKSIRILSISLTLLVGIIITSFSTNKKMSIEGAWKVVEVQTVRPDGTFTSVFPTVSLAIFSGNYYSLCWTSHIVINRTWLVPDSVKLARLNQSIINSGTFQLKDSVLSTKATFATSPMFVNGLATFKCSIKGDTLILKGLSVNSSDNIAHPAYVSGLHFVSKLVRVKAAEQ